MDNYEMTTTQGCISFLVDRRFTIRRIASMLDAIHAERERKLRQARKFFVSKNPILVRRAETIEAEVKRESEARKHGREFLHETGRELMGFRDRIDALVPMKTLLDILNVNAVDRPDIPPDAGIVEIAYAHGLEDSAMFRGSDWKRGPLALAILEVFQHELINNQQFQEIAHEKLFGMGGAFEFMPMYRTGADGQMIRVPPKLRLADKCDIKGGTHAAV